jgi:hypothetical protein
LPNRSEGVTGLCPLTLSAFIVRIPAPRSGSATAAPLLLKLALLAAVLFNRSFVFGGRAREFMPTAGAIHYKVQVICVVRMEHRFQ